LTIVLFGRGQFCIPQQAGGFTQIKTNNVKYDVLETSSPPVRTILNPATLPDRLTGSMKYLRNNHFNKFPQNSGRND
jgi:hypothetical protein